MNHGGFCFSTWVDSLHLRPLVRFGQTKAMVGLKNLSMHSGILQTFVRGEMIVIRTVLAK